MCWVSRRWSRSSSPSRPSSIARRPSWPTSPRWPSAPAGFLTAPEGWGPSQIRELQLWLNAQLAGQAAERAKLVWTPAGAQYQALKDPPLKDDFDEWLARIVAFAFSLPPTPFVKQMNRATAGEDQDRALEEPTIDPSVQGDVDDKSLRNGSATINEIRARRGQGPVDGGDTPRIYAGTGATPLAAAPQTPAPVQTPA